MLRPWLLPAGPGNHVLTKTNYIASAKKQSDCYSIPSQTYTQAIFHPNSAAKPNIVLSIQIFDLTLSADSAFEILVLTLGVRVDCQVTLITKNTTTENVKTGMAMIGYYSLICFVANLMQLKHIGGYCR